MKNRTETLGLILLLLLSVLISFGYSVSADVTFDNSTVFQVGNENYTFPSGGITFSQVSFNGSASWITFNTTGFNVSSSNPINLTIVFLNTSISGASVGDSVLQWSANTTGGNVWFNLSGFKNSHEYTLYINGTININYTSNATGVISFNESTWSEHDFELRDGDQFNVFRVQINYVFAQSQAGTNYAGILVAVCIILILLIALVLILQIRSGEFNIVLAGTMITIAVSVIVLFVFLNTGTYMNDTLSGSLDETEGFTVTPSGSDETFNCQHNIVTIQSVRLHNGTAWRTLPRNQYSTNIAQDLVVVAAAFV